MIVLLVNFCFYLAYTLFFSIKAKTVFTIHNLISLWFSFVALAGCLSYASGYYENVFGHVNDFKIYAYILAFLAFIIYMWPFRSYVGRYISLEYIDDNRYRNFLNFLVIMYIPFFLVLANAAVHLSAYDGADIYNAKHYDGVALYRFSNLESKIMWLFGTFFQVTQSFIYFHVCGAFMQMKKKGKKFVLYNFFILTFTLSVIFLNNYVNGARGYLFFISVSFMILFVPFYKYFPRSIKKMLVVFLCAILTLFFMYTIALTISRFDNSKAETPFSSVVRYIGEPFPNLDHLYYDKVRVYANGMRMYGFFFSGQDRSSLSLGDQHLFWERLTGVPILNYKTLWGDFYVEFGPIVSFFFIFSYAALFRLFVKKQTISIEMSPIMWFYLEMAGYAPMLFSKRDYTGFRNLIICILIYFVVKRFRKHGVKLIKR